MQLQGQYIPIDDGHQLHVVTSGDDTLPPFLMLHCWTGNWTQWEATIHHLDGKFRFIVPDQLGFGGSPKPAGDYYQIDKQAHRTYQILQHFGYDKATVIGHSMGGMIGLTLAGLYPDAVEKLIVVDPAVTGKTHPLTTLLTTFLKLGRYGITQPFELAIYLGQRFPFIGGELMRVFFAHPHQYPDAVMYWGGQSVADGQLYSSIWAEKAIGEWDVTPLLPSVTADTLALWGELDYTIPIEECDVLESHITNFQAIKFPQIGHFPMVEAWDAYIKAIETFVK